MATDLSPRATEYFSQQNFNQLIADIENKKDWCIIDARIVVAALPANLGFCLCLVNNSTPGSYYTACFFYLYQRKQKLGLCLVLCSILLYMMYWSSICILLYISDLATISWVFHGAKIIIQIVVFNRCVFFTRVS